MGLRLLPFRPPTASGANKFLAEQVHVGGLIIFQPFKSFAQNYLIRIFQGHTFKYDVISLTKQITLGSMGQEGGECEEDKKELTIHVIQLPTHSYLTAITVRKLTNRANAWLKETVANFNI